VKPDRDAAIEQMLKRGLPRRGREDASGTMGMCLEPEALAAWVDGGLKGAELEQADRHVADCQRCQAMLAAIGRATPASPAPEGWWRRYAGFGWLMPVAAGAAAVVLWMIVPGRTPTSLQTSEPVLESSRAAAEPTALPKARDEQPAVEGPRQPDLPSENERRPDLARPVQTIEAPGARKAETPAAPVDAGADALFRTGQLADSRAAPAPAAPAAAAAEAMSANAGRAAAATAGIGSSRGIWILSPDPKIVWQLNGPGVVRRSIDGGVSWEASSTGGIDELTAGAAPSPTVCWLVGRQGVVLRTTDGQRWQRVASPVQMDLTAVQATDAAIARVTAADGRIFITADGGSTWTSVRLQEF
jgi:hypothetical protein